jgi:acetolactate synthase small subunit
MTMSREAASVAETSLSETAYFFVHAQAEPGVMPRVLGLFSKRGLVPSGWHSTVTGADLAGLTIEIQMRGLGREITDYIAACLRQIASVEAVLTYCQGHSAN